jgi:hypothetical protein
MVSLVQYQVKRKEVITKSVLKCSLKIFLPTVMKACQLNASLFRLYFQIALKEGLKIKKYGSTVIFLGVLLIIMFI